MEAGERLPDYTLPARAMMVTRPSKCNGVDYIHLRFGLCRSVSFSDKETVKQRARDVKLAAVGLSAGSVRASTPEEGGAETMDPGGVACASANAAHFWRLS